MSIVAEFQESIRLVIPHIVDLLGHREPDVRMSAAVALTTLSSQGIICRIPSSNISDILF